MPVRHFSEIEKIYNDQIVNEGVTVGGHPKDGLPKTEDKPNPGKDFMDTCPTHTDGFNKNLVDTETLDKPSVHAKETMSQDTGKDKKDKKRVKKESKEINNSTMKEKNNNKSSFDRLFEDVMGDEGFSRFEEDDMDMDLGGDELGDDLGGDEGGDMVTLELPRDLAEQLHSHLMDVVGGGEDDLGDDLDVEDLPGEDDELQPESHVELENAPDSVTKLAGHNNKVGGDANPGGGSADSSAHGQEDGGKPKAAADGVGKLTGKGNKVGGKVSGGNKHAFKA